MHRKLNLRLLLWVLAVLVPAGVLVHFLHSFQVRRHAQVLLDQGDEALTHGTADQALAHYARYLAFVPNDAAAREKYARLFERIAGPLDRLRAIFLLQQLLIDRADMHDVRFRLAQNLILVGRIGDAIHELHALEGLWPDPAELKHLLGWCEEARGQYREAAEAFRAAVKLDSHRLVSAGLLAEVLSERLHDPREARKVVDAMVAANPKAPRAYLIRARFHESRDERPAVERDLQSARALAPDEPDVVLALAAHLAGQGKSAAAFALLEPCSRSHPAEPALYKAMADIKIRAGERAAAVPVVARGLDKLPRDVDLLGLHADLLIDQHDLTSAQRQVRELRRIVPGSFLPDYLQARIAVAREQWPDAETLLQRCRKQLTPGSTWASRVYALLGLCHHHAGDTVQELAAFRQAVKAEPGWAVARMGLGAALLEAGRVEDAVVELQQARGAADPPPELWAALARALFQRNQWLPESQRRWADVEAVLKRARAAQPATAAITILEAEVLAARDNYEAARTLLDQGRRAKGPGRAQLWCALAELVERHGEPAEADRILAAAEAELGDRLDIRLARCRLWSWRGTPSPAQLTGLAQNVEALAPAERRRLRRELAETLTRLGDLVEAERLWQQVAAEQPQDVRSHFALAELAIQANRPDTARQRLAELRRLEGTQGTFWRFGTAELRLLEARTDRAKLAEVRKLLADLERRQPDWGRLPLLAARADELEGRFDQAIRHYEQAVQRGELHHRVVARLLELLLDRQDYLRAEEALGRFLHQRSLTPELARLGAETAAGNHNRTLAQVRAAQARPLPSRDYRAYLWHARIDQEIGADADADAKLDTAVRFAPHAPDAWLARVQHLARTKQPAAAVFAELQSKLPADRQPLVLARCHEALHEVAQAEAAYEQALAAQPDDFITLAHAADFYLHQDRTDRAEPLLRRLLSPAVAAPAEHADRARRQLAILLADRGAAAHAEALRLADGPAVADQRVRLYLRGQDPAELPRALSQFQESLVRQPPTPAERLLLAELCLAAGKPGQARTALAPLATLADPQPQHLACYAGVLVRTGELDEAARAIARLERWEPTAPRTRALHAALLQARAAKKR